MNPPVSRRVWMTLAGSAAIFGLSVVGSHLWPLPTADEPAYAALEEERSGLVTNDDKTRDILRERVNRAEATAWTDVRLAALREKLGPGWQWQETKRTAPWRDYILTREGTALSDWPRFIAAARLLGREAGLTVCGAGVTATGEGPHRQFARLRFTVRLRWAQGNEERAQASLPVSGAALQDSARGRSGPASRRRPSVTPSQSAKAPARSGCGRTGPTTREAKPFRA